MRTKFRKDETTAFTTGTVIEWRNGSHWHPGIVEDGTVRKDPYGGPFQHIIIRNTSRKGGVPHGEIIQASPTHVRLRPVEVRARELHQQEWPGDDWNTLNANSRNAWMRAAESGK